MVKTKNIVDLAKKLMDVRRKTLELAEEFFIPQLWKVLMMAYVLI